MFLNLSRSILQKFWEHFKAEIDCSPAVKNIFFEEQPNRDAEQRCHNGQLGDSSSSDLDSRRGTQDS